jgi:hypothetical protein
MMTVFWPMNPAGQKASRGTSGAAPPAFTQKSPP